MSAQLRHELLYHVGVEEFGQQANWDRAIGGPLSSMRASPYTPKIPPMTTSRSEPRRSVPNPTTPGTPTATRARSRLLRLDAVLSIVTGANIFTFAHNPTGGRRLGGPYANATDAVKRLQALGFPLECARLCGQLRGLFSRTSVIQSRPAILGGARLTTTRSASTFTESLSHY